MTATASSTTVLLDVWSVSRRVGAFLDAVLEGTGMGATDYGLYSMLRLHGPVTPTRLAQLAGAPPTTTSQALRRLEGRGHLERRPNPEDARSQLVALSPDGVAAHDRTREAFVPALRAVEAGLGHDHDAVRWALGRLDGVVADVMGDDAVPDLAPAPDAEVHVLHHGGPALAPAEADEVRRFIAWLRYRG